MINKKKKAILILIPALIFIIILAGRSRCNKPKTEYTKVIEPHYGDIRTFISTTGTVLPQNRLEIKPSTNGRIDRILVVEGQNVRAGQILIWMSSMERAALIDSARAQGKESLKYWENAYKPIPIVAPISGKVIVRSVEPGQTVDASTAILVLSDRLIVTADVDETDIGKIKIGQLAVISLDAYPEVKVNGRVSHISYESKIINNVTMYEVETMPDKVPGVFRSGMSANIDIIEHSKENILLLPVEALKKEAGKYFVTLSGKEKGKTEKRFVETGISDGENMEIISGIGEQDKVVLTIKKLLTDSDDNGTNPFLPFGRRKKK